VVTGEDAVAAIAADAGGRPLLFGKRSDADPAAVRGIEAFNEGKRGLCFSPAE
jgi:hypothetical protein